MIVTNIPRPVPVFSVHVSTVLYMEWSASYCKGNEWLHWFFRNEFFYSQRWR